MGPWRDLSLFLLAPLWIIPLMSWFRNFTGPANLALIVLALGGLGHHLPGWISAYTDPALRKTYPLRLTLGPIVIIGTCVLFAVLGLNGMTAILGAWSTWHGATQVHGFNRIYDAKAGSVSPATARWDLYACLAWFGAAVLHSSGKQVSLLGNFYAAGGPLLAPVHVGHLRMAWDAGTAAITLVFLWNAWKQIRQGNPPSPLKFVSMSASIGFWWYSLTQVDEMIYGVLIWEMFHDVQYNALVWIQGRRRIALGKATGRLGRFLFRPGVGRIAFYLALSFLYGGMGLLMRYDHANSPEKLFGGADGELSALLTRIVIASALLHFYFDGFIWRIRKEGIREGLGIAAGVGGTARESGAPAWLGHGWKWILFVVPVAWLGVREYSGKAASDLEIVHNLAALAPGNWGMHTLSGVLELGEGREDSAIGSLQRAIRIKPDQVLARELLGNIRFNRGELELAVEEYTAAVRSDSAAFDESGRMGMALAALGRFDRAEPYLDEALKAYPYDSTLLQNLAVIKLRRRDLSGALPVLDMLTETRPGGAWAWNQKGVVLEALGRKEAAVNSYRKALAADPGFRPALGNLERSSGPE